MPLGSTLPEPSVSIVITSGVSGIGGTAAPSAFLATGSVLLVSVASKLIVICAVAEAAMETDAITNTNVLQVNCDMGTSSFPIK